MAIQLNTLFAGEIDVRPKKATLFTTDNLETILQPNYLLDQVNRGNPLKQGDFVFATYDSGASNGVFTVEVSGPNSYQLLPYGVPGNLPEGDIYVGNEDNEPVGVSVSGDINLSLTGLTTIVDNAITTPKIADSNIITSKLADQCVTTDKIADSNVTTVKILDGAITTLKIADGNVTTSKILDANITTSKIADSNITTAKILDANVITSKLADGAVTSSKILDSNVTTSKIADGNVTLAKLAPGIAPNQVIIAGGTFTYESDPPSDTFAIPVPGITGTDLPFVALASYSIEAPAPSILSYVSTTNEILVNMSSNPGLSEYYYIVTRTAS